jgi:hypothetical protein
MSSKLLTEEEVGQDRVYEVRIRDLKADKQKSFSLYVKKGTKIGEYADVDSLKEDIERHIKTTSI